MDAEFLQLAREAVVALRQPNWAEVAGLIVSGMVGFGQIGLIGRGLHRMGEASEERNRQLDQQAETLGKIGQALDRQGQALERQGEVLAELLRRSA